MVEALKALLLGVVQGVAEFLPISSSGHLRVVQDVFGWTEEFGLAFDTLLHLATLLAVVIYFRSDLWHMAKAAFSRRPEVATDRRLAWLIVVATVPTGLIGLAGADWFESVPTLYVGIAFLITSAALTAADRWSRKSLHDAATLDWWRAVVVGVAQGVAIMPGISRAGATMVAGLGMGLDREQAARFSFLLSTPIILLAGAKQGIDVIVDGTHMPGLAATLVGFAAASVTGYLAIAGLMLFIRNHSFSVFAVYTAVLGTGVIVWQLAM